MLKLRLFIIVIFLGSVSVESLERILASILLPTLRPTELEYRLPGAPKIEPSKREY